MSHEVLRGQAGFLVTAAEPKVVSASLQWGGGEGEDVTLMRAVL